MILEDRDNDGPLISVGPLYLVAQWEIFIACINRHTIESHQLCCVGVSDGQSLDCESLVSENSQLREDKEVLRKELKSNSAKAGQHQLMETAMRTRLQMVEGVPYQVRFY